MNIIKSDSLVYFNIPELYIDEDFSYLVFDYPHSYPHDINLDVCVTNEYHDGHGLWLIL